MIFEFIRNDSNRYHLLEAILRHASTVSSWVRLVSSWVRLGKTAIFHTVFMQYPTTMVVASIFQNNDTSLPTPTRLRLPLHHRLRLRLRLQRPCRARSFAPWRLPLGFLFWYRGVENDRVQI